MDPALFYAYLVKAGVIKLLLNLLSSLRRGISDNDLSKIGKELLGERGKIYAFQFYERATPRALRYFSRLIVSSQFYNRSSQSII